jgi:hypothetical protein
MFFKKASLAPPVAIEKAERSLPISPSPLAGELGLEGYNEEKSSGSSARPRRRFHTYQLKGEYAQPWRDDPRLKKTRINNWIVRGFIIAGVALSGFICYTATWKVGNHTYCLILDDDFTTLDKNVWSHEVQVRKRRAGSVVV